MVEQATGGPVFVAPLVPAWWGEVIDKITILAIKKPRITGPAALALATGAPIVTGHIARNRGRGPRYLVRLEAPISATPTGDTSRARDALTGQGAPRLAAAVQPQPERWLVFPPRRVRRDPPSRD